ncbi:MAG: sensor histidine kinase [Clostridium sp.]|nr:sensor histidine kinase [Clostridium sp.]
MKKVRFMIFLKDKVAFTAAYFISTSLVILIMYLTVYIKTSDLPIVNTLYAYLISAVIYIMILIYEYSKVRSFNKQLYEALNSENIIESIVNVSQIKTEEQQLFNKVLINLHKAFEKNIIKYEEVQKHNMIFINQWVHQMKTPVSVINLILQEDDIGGLKDSIKEENEKISQGLNIMIYNARMNEFNHDFVVEAVDLMSILRNVVNDNKKSLIRYRIFPKITGEPVMVETDKKWIYFVINQIIINAIKYTNAAKRDKKTININIKDEDKKTILSIKDNGIGIPNEDIGRVFNAFFTGKNGRKTAESTGMGMYLAKRICEELGHGLAVNSKKEKGADFIIVFFKGKNIFKL